MFAAIKARFGGNEATKKTQKALLKQQYESFSASNSESLDSIFNTLQKLESLLSEWGYTVVGASSTNNINNVNPEVSTATTKVNTVSTEICTASFRMAVAPRNGVGFDWSNMAEEEIQANMAFMAFSDSEVKNDKSCSKNCLKNYEALKKQYDDLLVKLSDTDFKAATYKRGLATLEGQIVKYREHEVLFSEEIALLKRSVGSKEYELGLLKVKQEKKVRFTDKSKKGVGREESMNLEENIDDSLEQHQMTDTKTRSFESPLKVDKDWKEKFFYPANHVESVNQIEKPVRKNNDAPIIKDWVFR
ncbi:hypothetical protein Tco_1483624 [Tanacetum coccineum]